MDLYDEQTYRAKMAEAEVSGYMATADSYREEVETIQTQLAEAEKVIEEYDRLYLESNTFHSPALTAYRAKYPKKGRMNLGIGE